MALVKCSECNTQISDQAVNCPKCGAPVDLEKIKPKQKQAGKGCLIFLGISIFIWIIIAVFNDSKSTSLDQNNLILVADTMAVAVDTNTTTTTNTTINTWEYSEDIDKMTSKKTKFAIIKSNESLNLEFPYDGLNYGYIAVRKKSGLDIYIQVQKGQITGGYDNNYFTARFDEEKAIKFAYLEPQDNSSDVIFIENESKFLSKLKKSKKVLISLPFYQNGNQILEFNTSNLKWE